MPRQAAVLTDTKIKALKPKAERYRVSDFGGLLLEVMPSGSKIWRYRYQLHGVRQPALTIGAYPGISLAEARTRRDVWAAMIARGESPKRAAQVAKAAMGNTVAAFGAQWLEEQVAGKSKSYVTTLRRLMTKDVFPALGSIPLAQVKPADIMALCDKIKARGAPKMALLTRNAIRRMYDFAIARQMADTNPAQALVARFIATEESRTRVLEPSEIGVVLRAIYGSDIRRALKLALNLLFITMVRKTELTEAKWEEFNLDEAIWNIPAERMKKDKPHRVYLSCQAIVMLQELRMYSGESVYVFPSTRGASDRPISSSTLNQAVRALSIDVQHFVLHDFRRTASTHLHEMGHPSDAIERALAHKILGIKGVYNRAEYAQQRRTILQAWADFVQAQIEKGSVTPLFHAA
jgi:integrase